MKISGVELEQIIKEEVSKFIEEEEQEIQTGGQAGKKLAQAAGAAGDVANVMQSLLKDPALAGRLKKVNTRQEFQQMLSIFISQFPSLKQNDIGLAMKAVFANLGKKK